MKPLPKTITFYETRIWELRLRIPHILECHLTFTRAQQGLNEMTGWAMGAVASTLVAEGAKEAFFPDEEKNSLARGIIDAASLVSTLFDGYNRLDRWRQSEEQVSYITHLRANCS